jgi:hypothetical protein
LGCEEVGLGFGGRGRGRVRGGLQRGVACACLGERTLLLGKVRVRVRVRAWAWVRVRVRVRVRVPASALSCSARTARGTHCTSEKIGSEKEAIGAPSPRPNACSLRVGEAGARTASPG